MSETVQVQQNARSRRRRRIVELMRGDIIRIMAQSQVNNKIFFIDYIDETRIHLIPDMRQRVAAESNAAAPLPPVEITLVNGKFPSELQIDSIELLYRNQKEQGYARQRGLLPGKWIEIEYITEKDGVTLMVYGEIKSLADDTDCIGVSVYNPSQLQDSAFIYIDFEFKGLSQDLNIKSIKVCNKPRSLVVQPQAPQDKEQSEKESETSSEDEEQEQEEEQATDETEVLKTVNLEFQKSPPGPVDNGPAQKAMIDEGDKIAITFGPVQDNASPVIFITEESRYYSIEEQQRGLLEALIDIAPTSKSHHLSTNKEYIRMIERYTQLRETFSLKTDNGNIVKKPYYGNDYKPMMHSLLSPEFQTQSAGMGMGMGPEFTNDWLMPIYVQKRKLFCMDPGEETLFEGSAYVNNIVDSLTREQSEYEQYYTGKSSFFAYLNNIRLNTTPYVEDDETRYYPLSKNSSFQSFVTSASDVKGLLVPAFNKSKSWDTCLYTTRYIGEDSIPSYPVGYMVRPYPFVAYSASKSLTSSIMDKTNAHLTAESCDPLGTSAYYWWSLANHSNTCVSLFKQHNIDSIHLRDDDPEKAFRALHDRFANTMKTEIYFSKKFNKAAMYNLIPTTEELAYKALDYFKHYYVSLSPSVLIKSLSPFFVSPEHITHDVFSIFSAFIHEHVGLFKSTIKLMKRKYEAFESLTYPGFGIGAGPSVNAVYALLTDPKLVKSRDDVVSSKKSKDSAAASASSVFDTTVVSKYPIKEWMVKGGEQQKILSNSELLSRMFLVDFGRCLMNEVVQMNMTADNLYGVNVGGVIDHFVSEAEKYTGVVNAVKDANDVNHANKPPKEGKFILAKKYESMSDLNTDNEASPHVPIAFDVAFDSTEYSFIQKYEKERRSMPEDVFKAFLIDKLQHMQQVKKKQKMNAIECAHEVDSMIAGRRRIRPNSKERAVVVFSMPTEPVGESSTATGEDAILNMDAYDARPDAESEAAMSKEYRYYKLSPNGTWVLDDTIPSSITPENTEFFGNVFPGAIVMKNNCLSTETGVTAESSAVVTSMAKANLISKITHEFDGIIEAKYEDFQKIIAEKVEYYNYRLGSELVIQRKKQLDVNNKQFAMGEKAKRNEMTGSLVSAPVASLAVSPHKDILNAYLGNGSFPRMQELIISFAKNYTRKANRPCAGASAIQEDDESNKSNSDDSNVDMGESCEWLYCKDSGAKLMPAWLLDKANAYVNDGHGEQSYVHVMDRICREYGVIEGGFWVDGKKCKSGMTIMPIAFSTYEGIDEQGFKIKTNAVISMEDDDDILLGTSSGRGQGRGTTSDDTSRFQEQAYIQHINNKFENANAHKINDVVTPVLKLGLGISPDRNGLRDRIITSVIHTLTNLNNKLFISEKMYAAENAQKKNYPSYESYRDRVVVMTTLAHIVVVIQTAVPEIRPSKTFRNCKTTLRGFPLDGDGGDKCLEYIACIASGVKDASKDVWIPVLSFKTDRYVTDIKSIIKTVLTNETDGYLDKMISDKRKYLDKELLREREVFERQGHLNAMKKWTQFLPLLYSLSDIRTPEPVPKSTLDSFLKSLKNGSHSQHEQIHLLQSKIMQYSFYIQKMVQDWIRSNGSSAVSVILFSDDHRPVTENSCCDDMIMVKPPKSDTTTVTAKSKFSPSVLEYFISKANANIREFNGQIERLGNILSDVSNVSKTYILSHDGMLRTSSLDEGDPFYNYNLKTRTNTSYAYSDDTIIRSFIHFFKLDYSNAYLEPELAKLKITVPSTYDPRSEMSDKLAKIKSSNTNLSEQFEKVLDEVNRISRLDGPTTMSQDESRVDLYDNFKFGLNEVKSVPEINLFSEELLNSMFDLVDTHIRSHNSHEDSSRSIETKQERVTIGLSMECERLKKEMCDAIRSNRSAEPQVQGRRRVRKQNVILDTIEFIELFDKYEDETGVSYDGKDGKQTLRHYRDASTGTILRFISFVKNAVRFMLQTVPGLLITSESGNDKEQYVSSKHWKFGVAHNTDISKCIDVQYSGLSVFRGDSSIEGYMKRISTGSIEKNVGYMIMQLLNSIPVASYGHHAHAYSVLNVDIVKKLYTYLFYKTVELYIVREPILINVPRQAVGSMSETGIQNMDGPVVDDSDDMYYSQQRGNSIVLKMRELMLSVMSIVIEMKNNNSTSLSKMREVMAKIRRKETEDMRFSFYESSKNTKTDAFQIKKTMLKLRIGEYSVGAQTGYRKYDREFDEKERDARNKRLAEGGGDPNTSLEAFEDELRIQNESNVIIDGQQSIAPMDGDEYDRDQLMRNEVEIISAC